MDKEQKINGQRAKNKMKIIASAKPGIGFYLIGSIIGFLISILGNLIAVWLQNDVIRNAFTPNRIAIIIISSILGLIIAAYFSARDKKVRNDPVKERIIRGVELSRIRLLWSKLTSKGKGVKIQDLSSISSKIHIDTHDNSENQ